MTGLRLAAYERARLEEIYTGHIIRAGGKEPKSDLVRGRMEGWVRVRVMGGTEWKRLWVVLSMPGTDDVSKDEEKKRNRRSIFGLATSSRNRSKNRILVSAWLASMRNQGPRRTGRPTLLC